MACSKPQFDRRVITVIGATGTGKSLFCNVLGGDADADLFPVSEAISSCTYQTTSKVVKIFGWGELVMIIDTPGLGDTQGRDTQHIAEMVDRLKEVGRTHGGVNVFVIVMNGQNPRMDSHLKAMIKIFNDIFTSKFLDNVALVFTRWAYDNRSIRARQRNGENKEKRTQEWNAVFRAEFGAQKAIPCFFLDSRYDKEDKQEDKMTNDELLKLAGVANEMEKFPCKDFQKVLGEIDDLKEQIDTGKVKVEEEQSKRVQEKTRHAEESRKTKAKRAEEIQKANAKRSEEMQKAKSRDDLAKQKILHQQQLAKIASASRVAAEKREEEAKKAATTQAAAAAKRNEELTKLANKPAQIVYRRRSSSGGCCVM